MAPGCISEPDPLGSATHTLSRAVRMCECNPRATAVAASCRRFKDVGSVCEAAGRAARLSVERGGSTVATMATGWESSDGSESEIDINEANSVDESVVLHRHGVEVLGSGPSEGGVTKMKSVRTEEI